MKSTLRTDFQEAKLFSDFAFDCKIRNLDFPIERNLKFRQIEAIVLYFFWGGRGGGREGVLKVHYGVCETGEWPFV